MAGFRLLKMRLDLKKFLPFRHLKKLRILPERRKWDGKSPLRIGFYTDTYLPNVDGVVNAMIGYKGELERRGDQVYIFTSGTDREGREFGGPRTFFFESLVFPPYPQYKLAIFPLNSIRVAKKHKIDLVHSHAVASMGVAAIASAKVLNLPLIGTFHTMMPKTAFYLTKNPLGKKVFAQFAWTAVRQFYAPFDLVTAPSKVIEKMLNKNGIDRTAIVPNGLDVKKFSPKNDSRIIRKLLGIGKRQKVILTAGRLSEEKNVEVLISAFAKVRKTQDAKFVIQGDGPAKPKYMKHAARLGLQKDVIFTGFVKDFEVPYFYSAADVFATASTFETQGLALLEAMATGRVCVGAKSLAIPEILNDGKNGFLFRPFDIQDCAEKMLKGLHLSETRKRDMERRARATALEYSVDKSTDKLMDAYRKVL
ncbi:MAG: glycosyltransferase [Candidatus Micrarchaeota archaeon]